MKCSRCNTGSLFLVSSHYDPDGVFIRHRRCNNPECDHDIFTAEIPRDIYKKLNKFLKNLQADIYELQKAIN